MTDKITSIDKSTLQMLRTEIENTLTDLGNKFGIQFKVGRGSYDYTNGHFKLNINTIDTDGVAKTVESEDYLRIASNSWSRLQPQWLHKSFSYGGQTYTIMGYKTKARKNSIMIQRADGRIFVCGEDMVIDGMKNERQ